MNITEDKLKAGIQIALGTLGLYTQEAETLLIHHIKALTIHVVVKSFGCGWNFCNAVVDKKGVASCDKCNRYK